MKLIRANKCKFINGIPVETDKTRLLLIGKFCQIGLLKGGFKVRNIHPEARFEGEFFQTLKEAVAFAINEGLV